MPMQALDLFADVQLVVNLGLRQEVGAGRCLDWNCVSDCDCCNLHVAQPRIGAIVLPLDLQPPCFDACLVPGAAD